MRCVVLFLVAAASALSAPKKQGGFSKPVDAAVQKCKAGAELDPTCQENAKWGVLSLANPISSQKRGVWLFKIRFFKIVSLTELFLFFFFAKRRANGVRGTVKAETAQRVRFFELETEEAVETVEVWVRTPEADSSPLRVGLAMRRRSYEHRYARVDWVARRRDRRHVSPVDPEHRAASTDSALCACVDSLPLSLSLSHERERESCARSGESPYIFDPRRNGRTYALNVRTISMECVQVRCAVGDALFAVAMQRPLIMWAAEELHPAASDDGPRFAILVGV